MTSRAACQTSASTQPPPIVPTIEPSSRTSIFAVLERRNRAAHVHDRRHRPPASLAPQFDDFFVNVHLRMSPLIISLSKGQVKS